MSKSGQPARWTAGLVLLLACCGATWAQSAAGQSQVSQLYAEAKQAQAGGDIEGAIAKYEQLLKVAPKLGPAYNNLGILYIQSHQLPKAEAVLEQGLKVDPRMGSADALLGMVCFQMAEYPRALGHLEAAVKRNPEDMHLRMVLAKDLIALQRQDAATAELREIVARDPKNQEAWYLLGKSYLNLSIGAMQKVSQIDPDSVLSHEVAGEVMQSVKNTDGAIVEYQKAIAMAPSQPGTHEHLAELYWEIGKWGDARTEFLAELQNDPNNCMDRWKAADSLLENNGATDEVITELNDTLDQCPGIIGARVDRAQALIKAGRAAAALPDIQAAEAADNTDPEPHFLLAKVDRAAGNTAAAASEMRIYAKLLQAASEAVANRARAVEQNGK